jgi:membrane protease YdiL (CAAX protease family)
MGRGERLGLSVGIFLAGVGLAGWIASLAGVDTQGPDAVPLAALATSVFLTFLAAAGVAALGSRRPFERLGLTAGRLPIPAQLVLVVGTLALSFAVDSTLRHFALRDTGSLAELDRVVREAQGPALLWLTAVLGIAPAFGEEIFFRGLLQRGLVTRLRPWLAIPLVALPFAALHGDWIHASAVLLLGIYLGVITHLAESIRASILCHGANNLTAVAAVAWGWGGDAAPPLGAGAALALSILALLLAARWRRLPDPPLGERQAATSDGRPAEDLRGT